MIFVTGVAIQALFILGRVAYAPAFVTHSHAQPSLSRTIHLHHTDLLPCPGRPADSGRVAIAFTCARVPVACLASTVELSGYPLFAELFPRRASGVILLDREAGHEQLPIQLGDDAAC